LYKQLKDSAERKKVRRLKRAGGGGGGGGGGKKATVEGLLLGKKELFKGT